MMMTLGQRLRERRRELGLTQEEVAARLGVAQQTVGRWEAGASRPRDAVHLEAVAGFLGVSREEAIVASYVRMTPELEAAPALERLELIAAALETLTAVVSELRRDLARGGAVDIDRT